MTLTDAQPIYLQVYSYYRKLIEMGGLPPRAMMPSVREAAAFFGINPNTVVKAYQKLEEEKRIVSVPKKGFYVSDDRPGEVSERKKKLQAELSRLLEEGYSVSEILDCLSGQKGEQP